jgi:uncharacterized protein YndB with AHSA1/START domain
MNESVVSRHQANETTLRIERLIAAEPDILFAFWTDPAQLVRWWGPQGYDTSVDRLEVKPGGQWRISLHQSGSRMAAISGVYRVVEPPRRLSFSWAWEDESGARGHETEVVVDFEPTPGGTRLTLLHHGFESKPARERHHSGWSATFDRLAEIAG